MKHIIPYLALACLAAFGCTKHTLETRSEVVVKPMHITIDINIKVDKALDDFFGDLDEEK